MADKVAPPAAPTDALHGESAPVTDELDICEEQARLADSEAQTATLGNVRARAERSAKRWRELARPEPLAKVEELTAAERLEDLAAEQAAALEL